MLLKIIHQITSTIQRSANFVNSLWIIFRFFRFSYVLVTFFRGETEFNEQFGRESRVCNSKPSENTRRTLLSPSLGRGKISNRLKARSVESLEWR